MTALEATGTVLAAAGHATLGTNLFLSRTPASPDLVVTVFEYAGGMPVYTLGLSTVAVDKPRIQVAVRGAREDYKTARDLALACRNTLVAAADQTVGDVRVLRWEAVSGVESIGLDEKNRPTVVCNFQVWCVQ